MSFFRTPTHDDHHFRWLSTDRRPQTDEFISRGSKLADGWTNIPERTTSETVEAREGKNGEKFPHLLSWVGFGANFSFGKGSAPLDLLPNMTHLDFDKSSRLEASFGERTIESDWLEIKRFYCVYVFPLVEGEFGLRPGE